MKAHFSRDELWPWYQVFQIYDHEDMDLYKHYKMLDIPEDKLEWVLKVQKDFREVQIYLEQFDDDNQWI